jgi:hypothetical protein
MLAAFACLFSCSSEHEGVTQEETFMEVTKLSTSEAQKAFAKLLSRALHESVEMRAFLKEEALAQFDNDYDVFYPFVKDKIVTDNKTFRDILLSYCEDEKDLVQVEESLLLLNILVPDLSWIGDFSAETWNVSAPEVAVICRDDKSSTLYENGEEAGYLPLNEIPGFPCLVVKNNERIRVSNAATRASEATYEFKSSVFDARLNAPQTRDSYFYENVETTENTNSYVSASTLNAINPKIITGWNIFKNVNRSYSREYIYYGIDPTNTSGELDKSMKEILHKFKVNPFGFTTIADQSGKDPALQKTSIKKRYLTPEEVVQRVWTGGNFEFRLSYSLANRNGMSMTQELTFNIPPKQAFSIERVYVHHQNRTMLRHSENTYTVDVADLRAKWIYPANLPGFQSGYISLYTWDLLDNSYTMALHVEEWDNTQTEEREENFTYEYVKTESFETSVSIKNGESVTTTNKTTIGNTEKTTKNTKIKTTTTLGSDNLGTIIFSFYDSIILNDSLKDTKGYEIRTYTTGAFEMMILPKRL